MSYVFVEALAETETFASGGRSYAAPSLVEDDDGIRLLLITKPIIPARVWVQASAAGAVAIVLYEHGAGRFMYQEDFLSGYTEHAHDASYLPPEKKWHEGEFPITYRQMLGHRLESSPADGVKGFVHLHTHSEYSALDGLSTVKEIVEKVGEDGQEAVGITDHGVCSSHPELQKVAVAAGIKPIFGLEANFVADRLLRGDPEVKGSGAEILKSYRHLILWATSKEGLRNLWAMSTEANRTGFYGRPRVDWDILQRYNVGVMASTACLRGPLGQFIMDDQEDLTVAALSRLLGIFGHDRLFIELHTNQIEEQFKVNKVLIDLAKEHSLPTIAVVDSHYACHEDQIIHRAWLAAQTDQELAADDAGLFVGGHEYHVMTQAEVRKALAYLPSTVVEESIKNTCLVADLCNAEIEHKIVAPIYTREGEKYRTDGERKDRDVSRLVDLCVANWHLTTGPGKPPQQVYLQRLEEEMDLLKESNFCGYFLIVSDYVKYAKDHGVLVGPGRGSGAGSLVAYLSEITGLDPVEHGLLFERFLTKGRTELPDFDVDFPASKREFMQEYVRNRYGDDYVMRVGTIVRLRNKGVFRDLARVLKATIDIHYPDIDAICGIIDEAEAGSAGLGISWEDLWLQHGELLAPYEEKYPLLFDYASRMVGRLKSYGRHAAGLCISVDDPLTDRFPMRRGEGEFLISEPDMNALTEMGLIKFDFLTLRTLDTLQVAMDTIMERHGVKVDFYAWREEYLDTDVWEDIASGNTLGIFQIETPAGTRETLKYRPTSVADLSDVVTLVRPGPTRSGLTATYYRRKNGQEPVSFPDPRLETVLAKTHGCILYQEDIMNVCKVLAGYDGAEADKVRSILGKKKVSLVKKEGEKFIRQAIERGMAPDVTEALFAQMEEFAKYSFNRSHALSYAILGYWCAWVKYHYPVEYIAACLSTVKAVRVPEFINEARRLDIKVLPPDINLSGKGFSVISDKEIRYGLDGIKGVGEKAVEQIVKGQPWESWESFFESKPVDRGVMKLLVRIGALESLFANRRRAEALLLAHEEGEVSKCVFKHENVLGPNGLPCTFDWSSEPVEITKSGKPKKAKPLPKKCTKACRNYTPPENFEIPECEVYSDIEIREVEVELLGIAVSSTPFDKIENEWGLATAADVDLGEAGKYDIAATIEGIRPHIDRGGYEMGFLKLYARNGFIDGVVFKTEWAKWKPSLIKGRLCLATVYKDHDTDRGMRVLDFQLAE